jgi:hypothetical protein
MLRFRSIFSGHTKIRNMSSNLYPITIFLIFRLLFTLLGLSLYLLGKVPLSADPITRPYFGINPVTDGISGIILGVWQRFDAIHFQRIATFGYSDDALVAFLPLYPLITRVVSYIVRENVLLSAMLVSNISCVLLLITLNKWLAEEGFSEDVSRRTLLYLLVFPTAFFLFVPYSESLFLLLAIISIREARRKNWARSSLAAFGASLTRLTGVCLVLVIAVEIFRDNKWSISKTGWRIIYALSPLVAQVALQIWQRLSYFPSTVELQGIYWNRFLAFPWQGILLTIERMVSGDALAIEYVDLGILFVMLGLGLVLIKHLSLTYRVYFWSFLLLNLSQVRIGQPLSGQARFSITLIPAFVLMALLVRNNWQNRAIVYPSIVLLMILAGQYVMWGWVG